MSKKYSNHFLHQAILQVLFTNPYEEIDSLLPMELTERINAIFPYSESHEITQQSFQIKMEDAEGSQFERQQKKVMQWKFREKNMAQVLEINSDSMSITINSYQNFEKLKNDFLSLAESLYNVNPELSIKRLGLRYINNITLTETKPTNWSKYLNSNLLCIFKVVAEQSKIARAFHSLFLNHDDTKLHFQYGMHNPDFPASIHQKSFILDYDAFYEGQIDDVRTCLNYLTSLHGNIEALFENSIKDALREKMGMINDD